MFAGPNGSGKSTLKAVLPKELLGIYLNPDELELEIRKKGFIDFKNYGVITTPQAVLGFFKQSSLLIGAGLDSVVDHLSFDDDCLFFTNLTVDSYSAAVAGDFLRQRLVDLKVSFTFETVMSHRSKVDLLSKARDAGYRTYLYFVATEDPAINISRVRNRVELGGHAVPEDRIVSRYYRSLELLLDAIRLSNRAYIFDNSGANPERKLTWIAEITDGRDIELKTDEIPVWFKRYVLDKVTR
jgi:predicted ABC-type ATPase